MNKNDIRNKYRRIRQNIMLREEKNYAIMENIAGELGKLDVKSILVYVSFSEEVDTHDFIDKYFDKYKLYVPYIIDDTMIAVRLTSRDNLEVDKLGNCSQVDTSDTLDCEVVIVPLVAFNDNCHRLGMGKAYYDRYLSHTKSYNIGIAYSEQLSGELALSVESHDIALDLIITESTTYRV